MEVVFDWASMGLEEILNMQSPSPENFLLPQELNLKIVIYYIGYQENQTVEPAGSCGRLGRWVRPVQFRAFELKVSRRTLIGQAI